MIEHINYLKYEFPRTLTDKSFEYIKKGVYYITGRDRFFRPVGVFKAKVLAEINCSITDPDIDQNRDADLNKSSNPYNDLLETSMFCLNSFIKYMTVPGKVENFVNITDLIGVSATQLPIKESIRMIGLLQKHYKCRVQRMISVGVGIGIKIVWKIISPFVDVKIREKVVLLGEDECDLIKEYIHPSQLEKKFGGEMEDITEFWPPKIPSDEYGYDQNLINTQNKDIKVAQMKDSLKRYQTLFEDNFQNLLLKDKTINNTENCKEIECMINEEEHKLQIKQEDKIDFNEIIDLQNNVKLRSCSSKSRYAKVNDRDCCCMIF